MSYRLLLKNETFQNFLGQIREGIRDQETVMKGETDTAKIFRAQGAVAVLEAFLEYPDEQAVIEEDESKRAAEAAREDEE